MGIFFKKVERKKSSKPLSIIKNIMLAAMILFIVLALVNSTDSFFIRIVLILVGVFSFIEGIESYIQKEEKKNYLTELGFGVLFLYFGITWL